MSAERIRRLRDLFERACELPPAERGAFVAAQCGDDTDLADELTGLLAHDVALEHAKTLSAIGIAQLVVEPPTLHDGQELGPWRVIAEIGRGGMGRVFRARRADGAFDKDVAIKVVRRDLLAPSLLERFSTERAVLGSLEHPNIARLIDAAVTDDGTPYVVMELVDGTDLVSWCNARGMRLRERVELFRKVVDAVAHAHRRLVVHRDIKASNVLVGADGNPKLLDFGLAKPLTGDHAATGTGERFLTLMSAAPEQFRGQPITVACDVYALGALLYELLAGRPPFALAGLTPGQVEHLVLNVPPATMAGALPGNAHRAREHGCANPRVWRAQLEGDLEAIVQRALRKEPAARYSTVEQLDADLEDHLANRPIRERSSQRLYRARKFVSRHRAAVGFAALSVVILLATTATIAVQYLELAHERDRVALERDRAQAVVDLLQRSFEAADPAQARNGEFTAADVLEAARDRLDTLAGQPDVYMHLAEVIARVEIGIGRPKIAAEVTTRSVGTLEKRLEPEALAPFLLVHAKQLIHAGDFAGAKDAFERATPYVDKDSADYLLISTRLHSQYGRLDAQLADAARLVELVRARGPDDPLTDDAEFRLAQALKHLGRNEEALTVLERAHAWQLSHGASDAELLRTKTLIANGLGALKRWAETYALARETLPGIERLYGTGSVRAAALHTALGNASKNLRRPREATEHYRRALAIFADVNGDDHPNTNIARYNLATFLDEDPATLAEAVELHRAAVDVAARGLPAQHIAHTTYRLGYAEALLQVGQAPEALKALVANPGAESLPGASRAMADRFRTLLTGSMRAAGCDGNTDSETDAACATARTLLESTTAQG